MGNLDPETGAELEPAMDIRDPYDKVYAILQQIDRDEHDKKWAQWEVNQKIRLAKEHPWPEYEPSSD